MPTVKRNAAIPVRLPPMNQIRIRRPHAARENPCLTAMSAILGCWASTGNNLAACAGLEQQLRICMDGPKPSQGKRNTINYHLARFGPLMSGQQKRK